MRNRLLNNTSTGLLFLSLVVFLSRVPFLGAGFGAEEDAWLLPLTAKNIALSGHYEMSRAPGHPLQELLYSWMWNASPFFFNLISAIASVIATVFFALSMKNIGLRNYLFAAFAFALTPVVFISSTYTIDYMLAMAFAMGSFYFLTLPPLLSLQKPARVFPPLWGGLGWGGVLLGIAIGFRITSGLMLIPFCLMFFSFSKEGIKKAVLLICITSCIGLVSFLPVLRTYGLSFFTYNDQFPYPNLPKVFFKLTIGVFGFIGFLTICFAKIKIVINRIRTKKGMLPSEFPKNFFYAAGIGIVLYLISYLRLPQKSAYLIPMIPFVILLAGFYLSERSFRIFCVLMTMSSFLMSMNLTDPLRGSSHSKFAATFRMADQEIFIDPFTGPLFADYSKRLNKMAYTETVFEKTSKEQRKIILICGWWYNELQVRNWSRDENKNVKLVFYIDKETMKKYAEDGYALYYLPEQNFYNDRFSKTDATDSLSKPYF